MDGAGTPHPRPHPTPPPHRPPLFLPADSSFTFFRWRTCRIAELIFREATFDASPMPSPSFSYGSMRRWKGKVGELGWRVVAIEAERVEKWGFWHKNSVDRSKCPGFISALGGPWISESNVAEVGTPVPPKPPSLLWLAKKWTRRRVTGKYMFALDGL